MKQYQSLLSALLITLLAGCASFAPRPKLPLQSYLTQGNWEEGLDVLSTWSDPQSHYEKGFLQTLVALEKVCQDLNRYGVGRRAQDGGFTKSAFPLSDNLVPETITYPQFRKLLQDFHDRLKVASQTLSQADRGAWTVEVDPGSIAMDFNLDGVRDPAEKLGRWLFPAFGQANAAELSFFTDVADAQWLAGYTKLLEAGLDLALTYDLKPLYGAFVVYAFPRALDSDPAGEQSLKGLKVLQSNSGEEARQALLRVITLGRTTWKLVAAESDDNREWIPGPYQGSGLMPVTEDRVAQWQGVLDDSEALLEGRLLLGARDGLGLNVKRLFQHFPDLDFTRPGEEAVRPYLEKVPEERLLSRSRPLWTFFTGEGLMYALWFN